MANPPASSSEPHLLPPISTHTHSSPIHSNPTSPMLKPKIESAPENDVVKSSPAKKTPASPWTHQETVSLIQAYQEKWYSLKKGQLKANQWEEVANTVAARCGYDEPTKSSTQCRHKIEKLRKRYRAELVKPYPNSWQYFELMDSMERGPLPIVARPMSMVMYQNSNSADESDSDDMDVSYGGLDVKRNKLKSINNIVRSDFGGNLAVSGNSNRNVNGVSVNQNHGGGSGNQRSLRGMRNTLTQSQKRNRHLENDGGSDQEVGEDQEEEARGAEEKGREEVREGEVEKELAAEIRGFAERFMTMENTKIEMMREAERFRMDMENKRIQMIVESQRKMVDTIGRAFDSHKKVKITQEI